LDNTKALEILATAAMYHSDVLARIEHALSEQKVIELQKGLVLFGHMTTVSSDDATRMASPARVNQYPQP
jgi:hypothetical protein